jgi:hypothetical protein
MLLAVPSTHAAFGPWDLDIDGAASFARTVEHHVTIQSSRLALYLEAPSAQLRAIVDLPIVHELARSLGLFEARRLFSPVDAAVTKPTCRGVTP